MPVSGYVLQLKSSFKNEDIHLWEYQSFFGIEIIPSHGILSTPAIRMEGSGPIYFPFYVLLDLGGESIQHWEEMFRVCTHEARQRYQEQMSINPDISQYQLTEPDCPEAIQRFAMKYVGLNTIQIEERMRIKKERDMWFNQSYPELFNRVRDKWYDEHPLFRHAICDSLIHPDDWLCVEGMSSMQLD